MFSDYRCCKYRYQQQPTNAWTYYPEPALYRPLIDVNKQLQEEFNRLANRVADLQLKSENQRMVIDFQKMQIEALQKRLDAQAEE